MIHWLILLETNKQLSLGRDADGLSRDILSPGMYVRRDVIAQDNLISTVHSYIPDSKEKLISIYDIQYNAKI